MNVAIPLETVHVCLDALYLVARSGGNEAFAKAHETILNSVKNNVNFGPDVNFSVDLKTSGAKGWE